MPGGRDPAREGLSALARALSVTRVARLTGLDRTGVEVASAIRPLGHVLQVTNGKGMRFEDAALGALLEAAELHAAERPVSGPWDSAAALSVRLGPEAVVGPGALDPDAAEPSWDRVHLAWRSGVELLSGRTTLVPSHVVHVPPPGAPSLGPALARWTSNGMGAAPSRDRALLHALLEVVERDRLARALPQGFTEEEIARRLLDPRALARAAPRTATLAADLAQRGLAVHLFDLGGELDLHPAPDPDPDLDRDLDLEPDRDLHRFRLGARFDPGLPCAAALIADPHGPVPVAAGYACRPARDAALLAALLEAAQSRATEIHGAREDVALGDRHAAAALAGICARARAGRDARRMPDLRAATPRACLRLVLAHLRRGGVPRVVAVGLEGPPGVAAVKVLVPGLLLSELL